MKNLKSLTNEEAREAIKIYYENKDLTVKEICELINVSYSTNFIRTIKLYAQDECENCGGKRRYKLESREYINSIEENKIECEECGHIVGILGCQCVKCRAKRKKEKSEEDIKKKKRLKERFPFKEIGIKDISLKEAIFLDLVIKSCGGFTFNKLFEQLCVIDFFRDEIAIIKLVNCLVEKEALKINFDKSEIEIFEEKENGSLSYNIYDAYYDINVKEFKNSTNNEIKELIIENFELNEVYELWEELCAEECLYYLDMRTKKLELEQMEECREVFEVLIKDITSGYSLGEMFYMIDYAARRATTFYIENRVSLQDAHKAIITNIKRSTEYKNRTAYNRPYNMELTSLYKYFIEEILENNLLQDEFNFVWKDYIYERENISYEEKIGNEKDTDTVLREFEELSLKINKLKNAGIPKEFIIKSLEINEEIFEIALNYKVRV